MRRGGSSGPTVGATFVSDVPSSVPPTPAASGCAHEQRAALRAHDAVAPVLERELHRPRRAVRPLEACDDGRRSLIVARAEAELHPLDVVRGDVELAARRGANLPPQRREPLTGCAVGRALADPGARALRPRCADRPRRRARCVWAVESSISATPSESTTADLRERLRRSPRRSAGSASGRAGMPAATTRPAYATRSRERDRSDHPPLGAPVDEAPRAAPSRRARARRASRTRRRARARIATFVANSVVNGAISSVASSPTPTA